MSARPGQRVGNFLDARGPHDAGDLSTIAEKDQCGPQLDAKGAAQRSTAAVFDLEVLELAGVSKPAPGRSSEESSEELGPLG